MSVGLQRLREDADTVRRGAIDKGEDLTIVDRALELDGRRRTLLGEGDTLKAERNAASKRVGEAIKAGAAPNGPEVAALKSASVEAGRKIEAIDAELATVEAEVEGLLLRIRGLRVGSEMSGHIGLRTNQPLLLTATRSHTDRAVGLGADRLEDAHRFHHHSHTSGIVRRAGAGMP